MLLPCGTFHVGLRRGKELIKDIMDNGRLCDCREGRVWGWRVVG